MSLKYDYADEIAAAMAKSLEDKDFLDGFVKQAAVSHEDEIRDAINKGDKAHCTSLYNKYFVGGEGDTDLQKELGAKYGDDKAMTVTKDLRVALYKICNPGPGSTLPADDKCEKCHCEECKCEKKEDDCQYCGDKLSPDTEIALAFTIDRLVKIANILDNHGFSGVAKIVDEAVEKLAAKKK